MISVNSNNAKSTVRLFFAFLGTYSTGTYSAIAMILNATQGDVITARYGERYVLQVKNYIYELT